MISTEQFAEHKKGGLATDHLFNAQICPFALGVINLDEVCLKINGRLHYLWRVVDQGVDALDIVVQSRRDKNAVKKFFRKL